LVVAPPGMLKAMQKLLEDDLNIPKERKRIEEFTGY
jgi:glycine betaine catabolism B